MSHRIEFRPAALRGLKKLPRSAQQRISKAIGLLEENSRPPKSEFLQGQLRGYLRIRTGDYRIIYCIDDDARVISIVKIGDRKDIYKKG